jgi:hypothetical protein
MSEQSIKNLCKANKVLLENIIDSESFSLEDKERISKRMKILLDQIAFWTIQNNQERIIYDLAENVRWIMKEYSE